MIRGGNLHFVAILIGIGVVWGLTIPLTKIAVSTGHAPVGLIVWELLISAICLFVIVLFQHGLFALTLRRIILFAVVGLTGTVLPGAFSYRAAAELPAGVMAIVIALVPLWSLPIAILIGLEKPELRRFLGIILGALAVVLIIGPQDALPDPSKVGFVLLALIAPFFYGFEGNFLAWRGTEGLTSVQVLLGSSLIALILTLPYTYVSNQWVTLSTWGPAESALVALSLLHIFAYTAYIWLVGRAGSVFSSQVAYLVTICGVIWSIALLNEGYSGWIWAALILLCLALSLVLPRKADASKAAP